MGATNVFMVVGKKWGLLVMVIDILKSFGAFKIAEILFSDLAFAGFFAGTASVLGHVFPFYLKFKGGKGTAAFAGVVMAYSPLCFLILLAVGILLIIVVNHTFIMPYTVGPAFLVMATINTKSYVVFILTAFNALLLMIRHYENVIQAKKGTDIKVRPYLRELFSKNSKKKYT